MAIVVERVSKRFGDFVALDDVSLEVPAGSLTALIGPSGGGKSTLLRIIAGLEQPEEGRIALNGNNAELLAPQHRGIGFVFQHYAAFKHMTVRDNIAFGLKVRNRSRVVIQAKVAQLIKLVQLEGLADRYPSQLSGGQRQRMALARALAIDPKVLLLDEPFGALDATVRKDLRAWLRRLHEEMHVTTIFVTHDQEEAMEIADRIAVIHHGRLEQVGTPHELYNEPANDFVMGFIGPVTSLGDGSIRPHDIDISLKPTESAQEAVITKITYLGFELRVSFMLQNGRRLWAQLTNDVVEQLDLRIGKIVYIKHSKPSLSPVLAER